jgi:hypothetical protein
MRLNVDFRLRWYVHGVVGVASNLDRYRPISRLGSGGMSTVELAEDTLLGRRVALKRMHTPDDVRAHSTAAE